MVEEEIKNIMRMMVKSQLDNEQVRKKKHAIENFMKIVGFTENDFPYETAKKDIDRHLFILSG
jgi:predicted DNA binding CopG/RHH family protein